MSRKKLLSFDLKGEMGFFKKPEINETYLTYNNLHKPALLGVLGAVIGLKGFEQNSDKKLNLPVYYQELKHIPIAIEPLNADKGNYVKTSITYNNSTGMASREEGGNLIVTEQTLVQPSFRCYLLLDLSHPIEQKLDEFITNQKAVFLPYFGKNDYSVWWDKSEVKEYPSYLDFQYQKPFKVKTLFQKSEAVSKHIAKTVSGFGRGKAKLAEELPFLFFENLPVAYDEVLVQYIYQAFVFTNATFEHDVPFHEKARLVSLDEKQDQIIQLF